MNNLSNFETDCVVVGAGVVGLATARAIAKSGLDVIVIEKNSAFGSETSSRNSEVIHAGIYYEKGSLKAQACVSGRHLLYEYLESRALPHQKCGKLIVATSDKQLDALESIGQRARDNGVDDITQINAAHTLALEPDLHVTGALLSPSTGILDSHAFMVSLLGEAEDAGATLVLHTPVDRAEHRGDGRTTLWCGGPDPCTLTAEWVVNCAGLSAPDVAARFAGLPEVGRPSAHYAKGNYFRLAGRAPFARLVYPVPEPGGLGVHLTLDLGGQARFGPDVEWVEALDYGVDPARADKFYAAIRDYWPGLPDEALVPDYAGIRPKIVGPGEKNADFVISGPDQHGLAGQIHMFGIESPGLTASLALAANVARLVCANSGQTA